MEKSTLQKAISRLSNVEQTGYKTNLRFGAVVSCAFFNTIANNKKLQKLTNFRNDKDDHKNLTLQCLRNASTGQKSNENSSQGEMSLRRRNVKKDENKMEEETNTTETKDNEPQDPISWFGILAPKGLRDGQKCFQKCLELIVSIANIKQRISELETAWVSVA
ncbi:hypothetical protein RFI_19398 [Reticulomyxa filosa]|uniref:Vacuolar ATPase assembly protein VMA22 n=1 Tax=Reticulomyxa filosa TaxID=46433 RepID=X6MWS1_RETFI|nr:hypothetical protein RFI_19398 [Reticulomyxa filosa]|eukprot:ETO17907.1 hypothetical protein RFI_19398 [Reticulomyxa filosa]